MKIVTNILALGTVLTMYGGVAVWAADQRYVTQSKLDASFAIRDIRSYSDKIDDLNDKKELAMLTPLERARLKRLINRRNELREELNAQK